jgi:ligand-binding sensor domain-containing protein
LFIRQINVGLMTLERDSLVPAQELHSIAQETVYFMIPFDTGDILIGTRASGLFISDGNRTRPFATDADEFLKKNQMYHAAMLADGRFAIGTLRGGVVIIDKNGRIRETLNQSTGLTDDGVYYLYTDRQQSLWLGLSNGIAHVETPSSLSHFGESSGIPGTAPIHPGRSDRNGSLVSPFDGRPVLAACSDGVYQIDDGSAKLVRKGVSAGASSIPAGRSPRVYRNGRRPGIDLLE